MNWTDGLAQALPIGFTMLAIYLLSIPSRRMPAVSRDGTAELWPPTFMVYRAVVCGVITLTGLLLPLFVAEAGWWIITLPIWLSFGIFTVWGASYYYHHHVRFDNFEFTVTDWRGRQETMAWRAVDATRIHKFSFNLIITGVDGRELVVSPYLRGYVLFKHRMDSRRL